MGSTFARSLSRRDLLRYGGQGSFALVLGSTLAACGSSGSSPSGSSKSSSSGPKRGGTLTFARSVAPTQLDPANSIIAGDVYTLDKIFEPLFVTSPAGQLTPWLAQNYTASADQASGLGQGLPADLGAARLHAGHPRGPRCRARRPNGAGKTTLLRLATDTEALSLMQTWWAVPISQAVADGSGAGVAQSRFSQLNFATHGITPLGYAAFAFALGVTAGALIRRTVPAMAVTLAIFAALQVAMPLWVRPNLAPADHVAIPVSGQGNFSPAQTGPGGSTFTLFAVNIPGQPGAWLLSSGPVNAAGQPVSTTPAACTSVGNTGQSGGAQGTAFLPGQGPAGFVDCLGRHGIREAITYQPASRYWRFQATETAIYLALALALAGYCFRRLSRLS
jgi:hypothetical protein